MDDHPFAVAQLERDHPPSEWLGSAVRISDDIYASWFTVDGVLDPHPIIWHWCPKMLLWSATGTGAHTIVSTDPLTLSPSYFVPWCCGLHGFITNGAWIGA
jgi:hypothetical protein